MCLFVSARSHRSIFVPANAFPCRCHDISRTVHSPEQYHNYRIASDKAGKGIAVPASTLSRGIYPGFQARDLGVVDGRRPAVAPGPGRGKILESKTEPEYVQRTPVIGLTAIVTAEGDAKDWKVKIEIESRGCAMRKACRWRGELTRSWW